MARVPVKVFPNGIGSFNPNAGGRLPVVPSIVLKALGHTKQQFSDPALSEQTIRQLNQLQDGLLAMQAIVNACPFINGTLISAISFVNGVTTVLSHHLGKAYSGAWLVSPRFPGSAGTPAVLISATQPNPASQIALFSDGTFLSDVWVF